MGPQTYSAVAVAAAADAQDAAKMARQKAGRRTDLAAAEADEIDIDNQNEDFEVVTSPLFPSALGSFVHLLTVQSI